jgi:PKD repeat protein
LYIYKNQHIVRNFFRSILAVALLLTAADGIRGQVAPGDFQHEASISDGLSSPTRIAVDNNDNIIVIDSYHKEIRKYDASGTLLQVFSPGFSPISVAIDGNGQIYTGAAESGLVYKVNLNGSTSLFYSGSSYPNSLSFSQDGHMYIADSKLKKVLVLDPSGTLIQTIGDGTLQYPTGVCYDRKNHRVLVGEHGAVNASLQTRVYIYATDGTLITSFGSYGNTDGKFYRVQGITVGRCGNIYVCDPFLGIVSVFSESGAFITRFGEFGTNAGQLNVPIDVAFNTEEKVILSSMNNGRLEVFSISDSLPSASVQADYLEFCQGSSVGIPIAFTGTAPWSFTYTLDGQNPLTVNNITANPYSLVVSQQGLYMVTDFTDATQTGNCISGSAMVSMKASPVPDFSYAANNLILTFTNISQNALTYTWDFGDNITSTLANPVHEYLLPGIYTVSLTAENEDCSEIIQKVITVGNPNGINSTDPPQSLQLNITPNPTTGPFLLEISHPAATRLDIEILSITGQQIFQKTIAYPGKTGNGQLYSMPFDIGEYPNGIYFIKITSDESVNTEKLVVNKQ